MIANVPVPVLLIHSDMSRFNDSSTWPTKLGNPGSSMQLFTNESISLSVNEIESDLQLSEGWLEVFVMIDYEKEPKRI